MDKLQLARRRVSRINNKIRRRLPLLADFFLTTESEQLVRLDEIERSSKAQVQSWLDLDRDFLRKAEVYKARLCDLIGKDEVQKLADYRASMVRSFSCLGTPAYMADFWHSQLRKRLPATPALYPVVSKPSQLSLF